MKQQTAVEWLKEQYIDRGETIPSGVFQQAEEMEKEQMIDFYKWMKVEDTCENAEIYFNYTNGDMLEQYLNSMSVTLIVKTQSELIEILKNQVADLVMMSKIELGDDVILEINRLQKLIRDINKNK